MIFLRLGRFVRFTPLFAPLLYAAYLPRRLVWAEAESRVDPDTQIHFPTELGKLRLAGLGVRKVSIFRVKVYSVGFYLGGVLQKADTLEESVAKAIETTGCAIRIVPYRNTDFSHLRDGFVRALLARKKRQIITAEEDVAITDSIQSFKSIFPTASVPKGNELLLKKDGQSLVVEYQGKVLGRVNNQWVARELMLAYFDQSDISPKLKEDVGSRFTS